MSYFESAGDNPRLRLLTSTFGSNHSSGEISLVFKMSGENYETSAECLVGGPTLSSILTMLNKRFELLPRIKLQVDSDDMWADLVALYKNCSMDYYSKLRITLDNQPAVDTGGVRRQVYSRVFQNFANNETVCLFDGPLHNLRPTCSAEARSSGLFKILGSMIAHSICQDKIGFPHLSLACYWYIIGGENKALQFASVEDLPADSALLISQVSTASCIYNRVIHEVMCVSAS